MGHYFLDLQYVLSFRQGRAIRGKNLKSVRFFIASPPNIDPCAAASTSLPSDSPELPPCGHAASPEFEMPLYNNASRLPSDCQSLDSLTSPPVVETEKAGTFWLTWPTPIRGFSEVCIF